MINEFVGHPPTKLSDLHHLQLGTREKRAQQPPGGFRRKKAAMAEVIIILSPPVSLVTVC